MSPEDNKELIRHLIQEALNGGNTDVADGRFTDDYRVHLAGRPDDGATRGADAFKAIVGIWRGACSDWHMTIEQFVAEGDYVATRFTTRGTHDGPLFGIPPTGKSFTVHGQELHRIEGGKVAETWVGDDIPSILVQLGVIQKPSPPGTPERS